MQIMGSFTLNLSKDSVMYISYIWRINYASLLGKTICNYSEIIAATVFQCFNAVDFPDIAKIHIVKIDTTIHLNFEPSK